MEFGLEERHGPLVDPPKVVKEEIRPLNEDEVKVLFETVEGSPLEALYVLAVTAGLRRGELLDTRCAVWEQKGPSGLLPDLRAL